MSREVHPFGGGGIAPAVTAAARQLSEVAEVTVFTPDAFRAQAERMRRTGELERLFGSARLAWIPETRPEDVGGFTSFMHAASARALDALRAHYGERGPDLVEFPDYLAEAFVTLQARRTREPFLRDTLVLVRIQTTAEICAVLDGYLATDFASEALVECERFCLRHADILVSPSHETLATYRRYYGPDALAPAVVAPAAWLADQHPERPDPVREPGAPLRVLFLGRLERRKGVQKLVRAMRSLATPDWELSLLGGDTDSAPMRTSVRAQIELMAAGDPRIALLERVPRDHVPGVVAEHDLVAIPSLWENWPNVALEAFAQNRPVLATPVGGLTEMVEEGVNGWLVEDETEEALARLLERLVAAPEEVDRVIASRAPLLSLERLGDADAYRAAYLELAARRRQRPVAARRPPLVSVVVPYFRLDAYVEETVASVAAQTHPELEVVVVNDGSMREEDRVLWRLQERFRVRVVTQPNRGLGAARNLGWSVSRGRYVLPLDADDVIEPEFVERCLAALEPEPRWGYVTTWTAYMDARGRELPGFGAGYLPLGNWTPLVRRNNVAGTCTSLMRRVLFDHGFRYSLDLASYEDWMLFRRLHDAGWHGHVIPQRLFRYRVRETSMMREYGVHDLELFAAELEAHDRQGRITWHRSA